MKLKVKSFEEIKKLSIGSEVVGDALWLHFATVHRGNINIDGCDDSIGGTFSFTLTMKKYCDKELDFNIVERYGNKMLKYGTFVFLDCWIVDSDIEKIREE